MVADGLGVPGTDADLVVEGPRRVVPHLQQPLGAEPSLGREVVAEPRTQLGREVSDAGQQDVDRVARGLDKLDVVARIPPTARCVDPDTQRREVAIEVAGRVGVRGEIGHRVLIVQMRRLRTKGGRDEVGAVALVLVERTRIGERGRV